MTNQDDRAEKESPKDAERIKADLEARLNAHPTLDTDLMEFLAIAGISYYYWQPFYDAFKFDQPYRQIRQRLEGKRRARTRTLSRGDRLVEGYIAKALGGDYLAGFFKTVGDFRDRVQEDSHLPFLSLRGIAYLNQVFQRYGIEPVTVTTGSKKTLAKYGLIRRDPDR